jgi:molybdopterin-guanine dinucleotide biosynthesis protein A
MTTRSDLSATLGLILAGGASSRMGGVDKGHCEIAGRTLLDRVIARLTPQCESLLLSSNENPTPLHPSRIPVLADPFPARQGPLAGLLAGFDWAGENRPGEEWVLSTSIDCPFLPHDLASRLHDARRVADTPIAVATSGERIHHVIALWHISLRVDLRDALGQGVRKVSAFIERHRSTLVEWRNEPVDPFFNVNTADDLVEAQYLAALADRE